MRIINTTSTRLLYNTRIPIIKDTNLLISNIYEKIDVIISKGKKFTENLFRIKQRQIFRAIESSKDNLEQLKEKTVLEYENTLIKMCETSEYEVQNTFIDKLLECKQTIIDADMTIEALDLIKEDLESEVDVDTEIEKDEQ